jgi:hypothetical protein
MAMSMNLMFTPKTPIDHSGNWAALKQIGEQGLVWLDDATVTKVATLLDGASLANGQSVFTYAAEEGDPQGSYVGSFGPSLLDEEKLAKLRALLAPTAAATALLEAVLERGVQMVLSGTDMCGAHVKPVNTAADVVEFNVANTGLVYLLQSLGVPAKPEDGQTGGEIGFPEFERAIQDNRRNLGGYAVRMDAFLACARRNDAALVHWG